MEAALRRGESAPRPAVKEEPAITAKKRSVTSPDRQPKVRLTSRTKSPMTLSSDIIRKVRSPPPPSGGPQNPDSSKTPSQQVKSNRMSLKSPERKEVKVHMTKTAEMRKKVGPTSSTSKRPLSKPVKRKLEKPPEDAIKDSPKRAKTPEALPPPEPPVEQTKNEPEVKSEPEIESQPVIEQETKMDTEIESKTEEETNFEPENGDKQTVTEKIEPMEIAPVAPKTEKAGKSKDSRKTKKVKKSSRLSSKTKITKEAPEAVKEPPESTFEPMDTQPLIKESQPEVQESIQPLEPKLVEDLMPDIEINIQKDLEEIKDSTNLDQSDTKRRQKSQRNLRKKRKG